MAGVAVAEDGNLTTSSAAAIKLLRSTDGKNWILSENLSQSPKFLADPTNLAARTALNPATGHGQILCYTEQADTSAGTPARTHCLVTEDGGATWTESVQECEGIEAPPAFIAWSEVMQAFIGVDYAGALWTSTAPGVWIIGGVLDEAGYNGREMFAEDPATGVMVICLGGNVVSRSTDAGQTWTQVTVAAASRMEDLNFGPAGFLAGDSSNSVVLSSPDGQNWSSSQVPDYGRVSGIRQVGAKAFVGIEDYFGSSAGVFLGTGVFSPLE